MLKAVQSREQGGNGGKVQRQRKQLGGWGRDERQDWRAVFMG